MSTMGNFLKGKKTWEWLDSQFGEYFIHFN